MKVDNLPMNTKHTASSRQEWKTIGYHNSDFDFRGVFYPLAYYTITRLSLDI
jgi:hypothetical protein